jgi:hypothetical protein
MKPLISLTILLLLASASTAQDTRHHNHHNLNVKVDIAKSYIDVTDTITLSDNGMNMFYLNSNLAIYESNFDYKEIGDKKHYKKIKITDKDHDNKLIVKYKGILADNKDALEQTGHAHRATSTSGIIYPKGIYLAGETRWVPDFENTNLKTFSIRVSIDKDWSLVSQGDKIINYETDNKTHSLFRMNHPTNQVCLVGNQWTRYSKTVDDVSVNVYLINPDERLANRYIRATKDYLLLYKKLIGDYPYSKFDVIENFWESGYGLPSFTLLGQKVIRFPWILNTSYPHELLHNYWGNGVYVDYDKGNWCEGITTYMADHLLKEKQGEAALYRRKQLEKYTYHVNSQNNFPVARFRSRYDAASSAIGYGKVLFINHMLRIRYGTETFLKAYADFYHTHQFSIASFDDIQRSFEKITGDRLDDFFGQWIHSTEVPRIKLEKVRLQKNQGQYTLNFDLTQFDTDRFLHLDIPVFVYLEDSRTVQRKLLELKEENQTYSLTFDQEPVRLDIDPHFDVMRFLDRKEVPSTLSQIFSSNKWTIVLPQSSPNYTKYKKLAETWSKMYSRQGKEIEIIPDDQIGALPDDQSVWILGGRNDFADQLNIPRVYQSRVSEKTYNRIDSLNLNESIIYTIPNPSNAGETMGYLNVNEPEAIGRLVRKLTHYGNFSYIGFEGKRLNNTLKGTFPAPASPLNYIITNRKMINWSEFKHPESTIMYR